LQRRGAIARTGPIGKRKKRGGLKAASVKKKGIIRPLPSILLKIQRTEKRKKRLSQSIQKKKKKREKKRRNELKGKVVYREKKIAAHARLQRAPVERASGSRVSLHQLKRKEEI